MQYLQIKTGLLLFALFTGIYTPVLAQQQTGRHEHPMMEKVDAAYNNGRISLDQKVLYKFYAGLQPDKLPSEFAIEGNKHLKCGTPAHIDYKKYRSRLSASTIAEIESLQANSKTKAAETYLSPSGKFLLHYETSGQDAVPAEDTDPSNGIPDYVEEAAAAADSSWRHEVGRLGYTDPILPGNPYEIYFRNFGFYGQTVSSNNTTYIEVHNTFDGFPPNTDPDGEVAGSIKVTVAHELKHAIQYEATGWSGESDRWAEMDATLMEEVVYDNVNDYYNYLNSASSIFQSPESSFYPGSYYHVTWALFFEQKYGPDFWPNVWDRIAENPAGTRYTDAMTSEIGGPQLFRQDYIESHLWHFAAGGFNSVSDYGFEEREEYPRPSIGQRFSGKDSSSTVSLPRFSANYMELTTGQEDEGFIRVELIKSSASVGLGLIAYFKDGTTEQQIIAGGTNTNIIQQTPWEWSEIIRLGIIVGNRAENGSDTYRIRITSDIPEEITLSQNYPNPFNPGTVIPFTLNEQSQVQIKVYDVTGRLVSTLVDEVRPAGFYRDVRFNGANLASGIYFYQLITDQKVLSRKMTLVK